MNEESGRLVDLGTRTKAFALRIVRLYGALPRTTVAQVLGKQVLRAGTSVGAHNREARRARSDAEFVSRIEAALAELEETTYWLELLGESEIVRTSQLKDLRGEADELLSILVTCSKNTKRRTRLLPQN
jgi:four helix bundle protein